MCTKGSFPRDDWNHFPRVFSCSHVLSNRKQSVMPKRAQESTAKEGSAVAKPGPMSLVLRNFLSAKKTSLESGCFEQPEESKVGSELCSTGARKLVRNNNQDPTTCSQEWRQDDHPFWGTRKLVRSGGSASSGSTRKLVREHDNQIERARLELHNMQISEHRYLEKVLKNLRRKLNHAEEAPILDLKTNVLIEELETMDTSKIYSKRLDAKEVIFPKEKGEFIFPIADGRITLSGRDQELRTSSLMRGAPNSRRKSKRFCWIIRRVSTSTTSRLTSGCRWSDKWLFGLCQEASYTAITLNPESNFTRREKNHSLFHWNTLTSPELHLRIWMLCKNAASMTIGISMDQEICVILGQLSLLCWKRNLQTDICGPGGDWKDGR